MTRQTADRAPDYVAVIEWPNAGSGMFWGVEWRDGRGYFPITPQCVTPEAAEKLLRGIA